MNITKAIIEKSDSVITERVIDMFKTINNETPYVKENGELVEIDKPTAEGYFNGIQSGIEYYGKDNYGDIPLFVTGFGVYDPYENNELLANLIHDARETARQALLSLSKLSESEYEPLNSKEALDALFNDNKALLDNTIAHSMITSLYGNSQEYGLDDPFNGADDYINIKEQLIDAGVPEELANIKIESHSDFLNYLSTFDFNQYSLSDLGFEAPNYTYTSENVDIQSISNLIFDITERSLKDVVEDVLKPELEIQLEAEKRNKLKTQSLNM